MRVPIVLLFTILCLGQTPEESIEKAQQLYNSGDLRDAANELLALLGRSEAVEFGGIANAIAYSQLATVYQDMGRTLDAESMYEKACDLLSPHLADPRSRVLWFLTTSNLATMHLESGQTVKAERLVRMLSTFDMPEGEHTVRFRGTQASLLMVRGRERDAELQFLALLEYWRGQNNDKESAELLNNLGVIAMRRGDWRTAAARLDDSLRLWKRGMGDRHPGVHTASANYGYVLMQAGRNKEAAVFLENALAVARSVQGEATPITPHLLELCAQALRAVGRTREAKSLQTEADRMTSAVTTTDPGRHTVHVSDLVRK
jgi:tetratricopeptide (TPR) repeat protein